MESHGKSAGKSGDITTDEDFLKEMTAHHEAALVMAKAVLSFTKNPGVKKLAQSIVKTQSKEIAIMKSLASGSDDASLVHQVLSL